MKVPQGYFEGKKKDFMQFARGDEDMIDLEQEAPILESFDKKHGFSLPRNYFENAERSVLDGVRSSATKTRSMGILRYAAAASLLFVFGYFGLRNTDTAGTEAFVQTLETLELEKDAEIEDAYAFLLEELDDFTDEELLYEDAFVDFISEEESVTDDELDLIINDLLDEYQVEDFEDIF